MSQWTHINGSIRIDDLRFDRKSVEEKINEIKEVMGEIINYDDFIKKEDSEIEKIIIPYGSEGSIQYEIIENPQLNCFDSYRIQIWGDLRDFGNKADIEEIKKWFFNILSKFWIRDAVLTIYVEGNSYHILTSKTEEIVKEDN